MRITYVFDWTGFFSRPSHTSLKSREKGQGNVEDLSKRDFRRELEEREHEAQREKDDKRRQVSTK